MAKITARNILLICTGILIFLAPVKFGLPIGFDTHEIWTIGIVILFTLWLVFGIVKGQVRIRYSLLDIAVLFFLLSAIISTFKAPNIHKAHLCLTQYFSYALAYFLVLNILEDEKDQRFLLYTILVTAVFISLYAVYQCHIGLPETREFARQYFGGSLPEYVKNRLESNRAFSTFIYPNTLAGYLFLCLPLVLVIKNKWLRIFIILIMLYALNLTFYRGTGSIDKIKNTAMFRWENWTAGFRMIRYYPIFGAGTYNFSVFYPIYKLDIAEEVQNAHNNFLQIWAEQGIIGFLSFCAIWVITIKKGMRMWGLSLGLIAFIIHNLIDFDWYVPGLTVIAWVFIGILVWGDRRYKEKVFSINKWLGLLIVIPVFFFVLLYLERIPIAERYLKEAKKAFSDKDLPLATVLARTSIKFDRDNSEAYFLLGRISNDTVWYKKALEHNPYNPFYYYHMGLSYASQGATTEALEAFKKAAQYYPANPLYHLELAKIYEAIGQSDLARVEYKYCLELNSKIEREYKIHGKMLKHLILAPSVVGDINM